MDEIIRCDICEEQVPEDDYEQCGCGRIVCQKHAHYHSESDTGVAIFDGCDVCYNVEIDDPR